MTFRVVDYASGVQEKGPKLRIYTRNFATTLPHGSSFAQGANINDCNS